MEVQYLQQTQKVVLVVVAEDGPVILGRNWLKHVILDWAHIGSITSKQTSKMETLLKKYPDVFSDKLGIITHHSAKLYIIERGKPVFCKPRLVPFALQQGVDLEEELPVRSRSWATPIVPVPKKNGGIWICDDFKVTINPVLSGLYCTLLGH